jgi:hypothetical protein
MPAKIEAVSETGESGLTRAKLALRKSLTEHLDRAILVRFATRSGQRKGRMTRLPVVVTIERSASENADAIIESTLDKVDEILDRQCDGNSWRGEMTLHDEDDKVLATVDLVIEPEDGSLQTRASLENDLLATSARYADGLVSHVIKMATALEKIGGAFANMMSTHATTNGEVRKAELEVEGKRIEATERAHESEVMADLRARRSASTKFFLGDVLKKYQPTFDLLAQTHAKKRGVERKSPADAARVVPTVAEIDRIVPRELVKRADGSMEPGPVKDDFVDLYTATRAFVLSKAKETRAELHEAIIACIATLGPKLNELRASANAAVGEARADEILSYFAHPWD